MDSVPRGNSIRANIAESVELKPPTRYWLISVMLSRHLTSNSARKYAFQCICVKG